MKKRVLKKLTVYRETLQTLDEKDERNLFAAATTQRTSQPCFFDTNCGETCGCW